MADRVLYRAKLDSPHHIEEVRILSAGTRRTGALFRFGTEIVRFSLSPRQLQNVYARRGVLRITESMVAKHRHETPDARLGPMYGRDRSRRSESRPRASHAFHDFNRRVRAAAARQGWAIVPNEPVIPMGTEGGLPVFLVTVFDRRSRTGQKVVRVRIPRHQFSES